MDQGAAVHTEKDDARDPQPEWLEPGEYLKLEMARKGYSASALAEKIGLTAQSIYNVTGATKRPISASLAHKLWQELGGSVEFWLGDRFPNHAAEPAAAAGKARQAVGILVDHQLAALNDDDDNGFIISPLDDSQIQAASVDLKMGLFVTSGFDRVPKERRHCFSWFLQNDLHPSKFDPHTRKPYEDLRDQHRIEYASAIELAPGKSTIVVAAQHVRMSLRCVGLLGQTTEGNLRGLIVHCGHQIDPGFNGPLIFRVKNDSDEAMTLRRGDPLASITIVALPEPVSKGYRKNPESQIRGVVKKLQQTLDRNIANSSNGPGWTITFKGRDFPGVDRRSALSALYTEINGQLANNDEAIYQLLKDTPIDSADIANLGEFLKADAETIETTLAQAKAGGRALLFGNAVHALTGTPAKSMEAYRNVCAQLHSLTSD